MVRRKAAVIVANRPAALVAKAAATTAPVVFATGNDPVSDGLVASLNRPGGNFAGVVFIASALGAKRLELLRQLVPKATTIAFLIGPNTTETETERRDVHKAEQACAQRPVLVEPPASARSRQLLQRSSNAEQAGCSSAPGRF